MSGIRWTQQEDDWIKANFHNSKTSKELYKSFDSIFPGRGLEGFKTRLNKLHLKRDKNIGQFGEINRKAELPIGTEVRIKSGAVYVKTQESSDKQISGYQYPFWTPKQRKIYEDAHGKIPDNHMVVFLNKNNQDFSIGNLYCISRSILAIMNKNRWFTTSRELTLSAIKYCELLRELRDSK